MIFVGIDVSKQTLDVSFVTGNEISEKLPHKVFKNKVVAQFREMSFCKL